MIGKIRKQEEEEICSVLMKGGRIEDGMREEGRKADRQDGMKERREGRMERSKADGKEGREEGRKDGRNPWNETIKE